MKVWLTFDSWDRRTSGLTVGGNWDCPTNHGTGTRKKMPGLCSQGKGNRDLSALVEIQENISCLCPGLRLSEWNRDSRQFVLLWYVRFFSTYLLCLKDHFSISVEWHQFDPFCGTFPDSLDDIVRLTKKICLSPMTDLLSPQNRVCCYPLKGLPRHRLKRRLISNSFRTLSYCNSMLQLKRVCPKMPSCFVDAQIAEAEKRLTSDCRQSQSFINMIEQEVTWLVNQYRMTPWTPKPEDPVLNVSQHACIESSRSTGGAYQYYFGGLNLQDAFDSAGNYRPFVRVFESGPDRLLTYHRRIDLTVGDCISNIKDILQYSFPSRNLIGICEPLKCRVITVHHASESALWSGYQKHLASDNRKVPQILSGKSEKIGERWEDFPQDIREIFRRTIDFYDTQGIEFVAVSDDASAATDSISPLLTLAASAGSLSNEFCPDLDWIFRNTWTGNLTRPGSPESALQTNGQCMGDRRSFVLLCRIHYAAKSRFCRRFGLPRAFAINGDDGVILLPANLVEAYFEFMEELWEINRLKTYVSKSVFSFNSQFYFLKDFQPVGIVRYSLVRGIDKFGEESQDPRLWNTIVDSNTVCDEDYLFRKFHEHWKGRLSRLVIGGNNYFLPLCAGGLGLRAPRDRVWTTSRQQRLAVHVADRLLERGVSQFETRTVGSGRLPMRTILNGFSLRTTCPKVGEESITTPSQLKVDRFESVKLLPPRLNGGIDYLPFEEETIERLWGTSRVIRSFF